MTSGDVADSQRSIPVAAARVLVVEDDDTLAAILTDALADAGFDPQRLATATEVVDSVRRERPAAVLLDLQLPGGHGFDICRELRGFTTIPLIMITGQNAEADRLNGLEIGADDYIGKPFAVREVIARLRALLRRSSGWQGAGVQPLKLDSAALTGWWFGRLLTLTPVEFRLLERLARRPGMVLSRAQLLDALHVDERDTSDRTIDSHIKNLRKKLKAITPAFDPLESVYGVGYKLVLEGATAE